MAASSHQAKKAIRYQAVKIPNRIHSVEKMTIARGRVLLCGLASAVVALLQELADSHLKH